MEDYLLKVKNIVPRFILVSVITTVLVLLFRWVFVIKYDLLPIKEKYFYFWIPLFLSLAVHWIWIEKRLKLLKLGDSRNAGLLYWMIINTTIFVMIMSSNNYLKLSTGELKTIDFVDEISIGNPKYVFLNNIRVINSLIGRYEYVLLTNKSYKSWSKVLKINDYYVLSIEGRQFKDSYNLNTINNHKYWYGIKFSETIDNQLEEDEKNKLYKKFIKKSIKEINEYDFNEPKYFENLSYSDDRDGFIQAIEKLNLNLQEEPIILIPLDENPKEDMGFYLMWTFLSFLIGLVLLLIALIFPDIEKKQLNKKD